MILKIFTFVIIVSIILYIFFKDIKGINKLKNKYSDKPIDPNTYETIKITPDINISANKQGYVYLPYIPVYKKENDFKTESDLEYDKFKKHYKEDHKYCPNCGSIECSTTLAGYIVNMDKLDEYKDLNKCQCLNCKDIHLRHDRISLGNLNKKNNIK